MMIEIMCAFLAGIFLTFAIMWWMYRHMRRVWRDEFKRLLLGIDDARRMSVAIVLMPDKTTDKMKEKAKDIEDLLFKLYLG